MTIGLLIIAVLFAALLYSGTTSRPAWAAPVLKKEKREMLWDWYRASGLRCIGRHEGWWTSNTGNGYFGRFQLGLPFQSAYGRHYGKRISYLGRYGTADKWPKTLQIHASRHGWNRQGVHTAWPLTSRICGI